MRKWSSIVSLVLVLIISTVAWAAVPQPEATPDAAALTRGDFAALLVQAAGLEGESEPANILMQHGIMKGVPGKNGDLKRPIQRVEAAALVGRAFGLKDNVLPPAESDIALPADHWGYSIYSWLTRLGLISGDSLDILTVNEGTALVNNVFETEEDVLTILKKAQEQSKAADFTDLHTVLSGSMHLVPRPGVEGADQISSLAPKLHMVQEIVLPDKIHQVTTVEMELPDDNNKKLTMESYFADGKMYQQLPDPETGEPSWFRYPEDMVPDIQQIIENAEQQTEVIPPGLEKSFYYKLLGTKELNGEQVYEIAFYGKIDDFTKLFDAAFGSFGDNQVLEQSLAEAGNIIDSVSFWGVTYVGVDDYLTRQADYSALVIYPEKILGEAMPMEAAEISLEISEYNYNQGITIEVPQEVLAAPELDLPKEDPQPEESQNNSN